MCTIYKFVCSDCFFYFLSEKEAKIAKEKALGIYKERKVTADGLKNCEIRAGIFVWARRDDRKFVWGGKWSGSIIYLFFFCGQAGWELISQTENGQMGRNTICQP